VGTEIIGSSGSRRSSTAGSGVAATAPRPDRAPARRRQRDWDSRYAGVVVLLDGLAFALSIVLRGLWGEAPALSTGSMLLSAITLVVVATALASVKAWEPSVLGHGAEEFSRLLRATTTSIVVIGLCALASKAPEVRPWVFGVIPVGGALAAAGRLCARRWLFHRRRAGRCMRPVLVVGSHEAVQELSHRTTRASHHGWVVTGDGTATVGGVPVVGDLDDAHQVARSGRYRIVSVAPGPGWSPTRLHHLAWELEGSGTELVVHPGLIDGAGPRLHVATVDGLPLLRLTEPVFVGVPRVVKASVDRVGAAILLVLLAPVMVTLALLIRADGGPAFFRQRRVGRHGATFEMMKFRSMVVDAEDHRDELEHANDAAGPLFKLRADPRVTKVGTWMRRYSLDELPQLFNVMGGTMSLVGPRPPLPAEVGLFAPDARRRLLVRPGLTGLWQISGRSDLSWEESVRLDLRYVENWNLALDAMILWKTVGAVVRGRGAY
jgi:exopolysaccharide biosynthesis polyprenyl glycosylphosphotransferase